MLIGALLTIRGKIFAAFVAIALVIGVLGVYAVDAITESGRLVVQTFDNPLMAINHSRSALTNFTAMEAAFARLRLSREPDEVAALGRRIEALTGDLFEDLEIAGRRSLSSPAREAIGEIERLVREWSAARSAIPLGSAEERDWHALDALARRVQHAFDLLINVTAGDAFLGRQQALRTIAINRQLHVAALAMALALAGLITLYLARRIVRPIQAASAVASRIAGGDLAARVPPAGTDETGALLAAMAVMQENLRAMMASEVAQRRSAQARMTDAIESSNEGVLVANAAGAIVAVNSQAQGFLAGVAPMLAPGGSFAAAMTAAERRGLFRRAGAGETAAGADAGSGEVELSDGRWLRVSRSRTRDDGFVVIWSDISALKEREAGLRAAKDQAEAANAAKTNFLANMSHELRTPLNAIIGFSEIMATQLFGPLGHKKYGGFAQDILHSGRHLLDIINDILDIAKSEAGKLEIRPRPVAIDGMFATCRTIIHDQCARQGLRLDVVLPAEPIAVLADPVKVRQMLLNLLSNAVKFSNPGGSVTLSARAAGEEIVLAVADAGIGMRPEDIAVALSPFGQVDTRLARKYEGTGLGLPLTKALVELHGGRLEIESAVDVGTTVRVILPRAEAAEDESVSERIAV